MNANRIKTPEEKIRILKELEFPKNAAWGGLASLSPGCLICDGPREHWGILCTKHTQRWMDRAQSGGPQLAQFILSEINLDSRFKCSCGRFFFSDGDYICPECLFPLNREERRTKKGKRGRRGPEWQPVPLKAYSAPLPKFAKNSPKSVYLKRP